MFGRGGGGLAPGLSSGRGGGRAGSIAGTPAGPPMAVPPHDPVTDSQLVQLAHFAQGLPENKQRWGNYVRSLEVGGACLHHFPASSKLNVSPLFMISRKPGISTPF